jgi:hypothetical protein
LIDFKKVRHAAQLSKDLRTPSLFGSSNGPTKHRTTGPRNDLTGILVCRRSAGFTDTFGCQRHLRMSPAIITRPSPPGLAALQTVLGELRFSILCKDTATEPLRKLTERLQDAHECLRALTGTSGFHRTPSGRSPTASGQSPALYPSRTGLSRPTARPAAARTTPVVHRTTSVDQQVLSCSPPSIFGRSPEPSGSTRVPSETHRSQFVHTRRLTAIASFRYKGPLVRRPLAEPCNVSGATVVTFESTPGFRLSYRR